jgi:hypothetical protein
MHPGTEVVRVEKLKKEKNRSYRVQLEDSSAVIIICPESQHLTLNVCRDEDLRFAAMVAITATDYLIRFSYTINKVSKLPAN